MMNTRKPQIYMVELAGAGGISHYTISLLRELHKCVPCALYTGDPLELEERIKGYCVNKVFRQKKTNPLHLLKMYKDALAERPSVVHFQLSQGAGLVLVLLAIFRLLGFPVVVTAHNVLPHEVRFWHSWIFGAIYRLANRVIVHSHYSKRRLCQLFPSVCGWVVVIDHGNYSLFSSDEPAAKKIFDEPMQLLFFGYIRHYKGLDILLEAIGQVLSKGYDFHLSVIGKPMESMKLYEDIIQQQKLGSRVSLRLQYVPDGELQKIFSRAACVILPYREISQSGVLQMAYAFGCPVIASDVGGLPEVVEHGQSGFIVPPADVDALADAIVHVLRSRDSLSKLSDRARELADTRFAWSGISQQHLQIYGCIKS